MLRVEYPVRSGSTSLQGSFQPPLGAPLSEECCPLPSLYKSEHFRQKVAATQRESGHETTVNPRHSANLEEVV